MDENFSIVMFEDSCLVLEINTSKGITDRHAKEGLDVLRVILKILKSDHSFDYRLEYYLW